MIDSVLSFVAPHYCCGCDKIGCLLCDNCKNNIVHETEMVCVKCNRPTGNSWLCNTCRVPYERAWLVGSRTGILQRLIGNYKFERTKSAYRELGELLMNVLPQLPPNTVLVPVPTVASHIRELGYDHMLLITKYVSKTLGLRHQTLLKRVANTKQRQASAKTRHEQAKSAFTISGGIDTEAIYLLVDDVITTGATIKFAAKALKEAGSKNVWIAAIARQTLD
jgi:competence protein ComFC